MPIGVDLGLLIVNVIFSKNQIEKIVPKPILDLWTPRTFPTGHPRLRLTQHKYRCESAYVGYKN